jgi:hypothetical protein
MREFIEKARRAAVVDGGLLRSASPGRDRQAQAEIGKPKPRSNRQPPRHHVEIKIGANPSSFPTTTKENRGESREGKRNEEREKNRAK